MTAIRDIHNVWRDNLVPASFRGVVFHVEASTRAGGRRTVVHEYPKRNDPYSEDMGRHAIRWNFTAYLILGDRGIGGDLISQMRQLERALDDDDAGMLIHPTLGQMLCMCERWTHGEQRQKGGYIEYDMQFVEAGKAAMGAASSDSQVGLTQSAANTEQTAQQSIQTDTGVVQPPVMQPGG